MTAAQSELFAPSKFDPSALIVRARHAMVRLYRTRQQKCLDSTGIASGFAMYRSVTVSAIDLAEWLDEQAVGGDRRWSGKVFTSPAHLWQRIGYTSNPRRHYSPTPLFQLNETRAAECGL